MSNKTQKQKLEPQLYLVATPLGTARDITLRALDILTSCDVIAAEDTRSIRKLLDIHGISIGDRPIIAYHDHCSAPARDKILQRIQNGQSVAYVSEAGTPLIADPGYQLVIAARTLGLGITAAPGPSAVITALSLGGLPTDSFYFMGFLSNQSQARKTKLSTLKGLQTTVVLYESPKRLLALIDDIETVLGAETKISVCRELTKKFEEICTGTTYDLKQRFTQTPVKGEIVLLINSATVNINDPEAINAALSNALLTMRVKDAAHTIASTFNIPKRDVYQMALALQKGLNVGQDDISSS